MATKQTRYDEDFRKSIVALYHNGKTQTSLSQEYDISLTSLANGLSNILPLKPMMVKS